MSDKIWEKIKLPKEMPKMPKVEVRLSPSCRLYEPEAGESVLKRWSEAFP